MCASQCDLVVTGAAIAQDPFPVKRVSTRLNHPGTGSASSSCIGLGAGTSTCELDLSFPLFLAQGSCTGVNVGTEYVRVPFPTVRVSRAYDVCRSVGTEHTITPS